MELANLSPFSAERFVMIDSQGEERLVVVVKATFDLTQTPMRLHDEQAPIEFADQYYEQPGTSSIKMAGDLAATKPGIDIVLSGSAYSTKQDRHQVDVRLKAGPMDKVVRVFGDRRWKKSFGTYLATSPEPFDRLPLQWERSFGGTDASNPDAPVSELRNPIGVGFRGKDSQLPLADTLLPNLENPQKLIGGYWDKVPPAGFGFVSPHWEPRLRYAGTYDEVWQSNRAPLLPDDFDPRFYQSAPVDQIIDDELVPGTPVDVENASPTGRMVLSIPHTRFEVIVKASNERSVLPMKLDTLVINGDDEQAWATWRGSMSVHGKIYALEWIKIAETGA